MELQIQITMSYHLTPARMAVIKKTEITSVGEAVVERDPSSLLVGMKTGTDLMESSPEVPSKIKNRTTTLRCKECVLVKAERSGAPV